MLLRITKDGYYKTQLNKNKKSESLVENYY